MSPKISLAVSVGLVLIARIFYASSANAQDASATSLADQLKAQYKLAKLVPESDSYRLAEAGTVLVVQKDGILSVPPGHLTAWSTYKDGELHAPGRFATALVGSDARTLQIGEKIYVINIHLDVKKDKVTLSIVECDSCNGVQQSSYVSMVVFQFPKGYLAKADVSQVQDVINQVLAPDTGPNDQQQQIESQEQAPDDPQSAHGGQTSSAVLTNDDIVKAVQAKLPDSVVIAKIKSSSSEFDTSLVALSKLKQAGVSDSVLQAIVDAQPAPNGEAVPPDPSTLSFSSLSQYLNTRWPDRTQSPEDCIARLLQRLQNAGYRTITDLDTALSNGSQKLAEAEARGLNEGGIYRPCGLVSATLQATDPKFRAAREEAVAPPAPGTLSFSVRHRHSLWETGDSLTHYCSGTLSVSPDGTVAYDCAQTDDPSGRCEHVSLPPGSLKEVKIGSAGNLRLASRTHLNYDFYGNPDDIKQAQAAISPLIQPSKK